MQQETISIDLKLPKKWEDLDNPLTLGKKKTRFSFCSRSTADLTEQPQLRYVFALLAQGFTATEVKTYCLHRWAGLKVLHRYGNNGWACRHGKQEFILTAEQVERATHALGWLDTLPTMPVRIARIGWHRAVPADAFRGGTLTSLSRNLRLSERSAKLA